VPFAGGLEHGDVEACISRQVLGLAQGLTIKCLVAMR
jgi:hypothetical protein